MSTGNKINCNFEEVRDIVWVLGFIGFFPLFLLLIITKFDSRGIEFNAFTLIVFSYSFINFFIALYAGILCGKGRTLGKNMAFIPVLLNILNFPIGPLFAIIAMAKLCKKDFSSQLQ